MKLFAVLTFTAALGLSLAACGARSSDEEQVRALFDAAEQAAEARDTLDVLALVAEEYRDAQGLDRDQLRNFLRAYFLSHPRLELVVRVESLEFPVDGLAHAVVTVATVELGDPALERLKLELRRGNGGWQVTRADRVRG